MQKTRPLIKKKLLGKKIVDIFTYDKIDENSETHLNFDDCSTVYIRFDDGSTLKIWNGQGLYLNLKESKKERGKGAKTSKKLKRVSKRPKRVRC